MLQKNTIDFLKSLKKNNNKPWFDENRKKYESSKADFKNLVQSIINSLTKIDEQYSLLKTKDCMFRINRDVRFSKDKSPYKTNFGAGFTIGGKKSNLAGYYLHIEPGNVFIGGGLWMPDADSLKKIRQEIDYNFSNFKDILSEKKFVASFEGLSTENKLVNAPKGYEKENIALEYLKLKSYTASMHIADEIVFNKNFEKKISEQMILLTPFIEFINRAIID
jgi:uncharacterized protein (TIGR02453 family)